MAAFYRMLAAVGTKRRDSCRRSGDPWLMNPSALDAEKAALRSEREEVLAMAEWGEAGRRGRLRLDTLVSLRWRALYAEIIVLLICIIGMRLPIPWEGCAVLIIVGAAFNLWLSSQPKARTPAEDWEIAAVLSFNILQLSGLLFLTGGILNPFAALIIAPTTLAAATVSRNYLIGVVVLAITCVAVMSVWSLPLPLPDGLRVDASGEYRAFMTIGLQAAIAFTASYAWRAAIETEKMELALNVTRQVLAREQKLSALGALAAAAAHELGTPLATIQIVAKEIARAEPTGPLREDADLLVSQAERCREILKRLTDQPETEDVMHARLSLLQFVNEVIEPHLAAGVRVEAVVSGPPGEKQPDIRRLPEMLHAMTTLVENAADFARSEVLVRARFDTENVTIEVRDDGPGFAPDVLPRLGQPYVTSRPGGEGSRSGHTGMGLGVFIAKTLLEKSGAEVVFENGRRGGGVVSAKWPKAVIEAPPLHDFRGLAT